MKEYVETIWQGVSRGILTLERQEKKVRHMMPDGENFLHEYKKLMDMEKELNVAREEFSSLCCHMI